MGNESKAIPTGIEDFKKIISENYYYVDKTDFIERTFPENVVLYTRPRRFGKTLNMSMLYYFYSLHEKENHHLFDGLKISYSDKAAKYQNKFPVIFLTLKDITEPDFSASIENFSSLISDVFSTFHELADSPKLLDHEKKTFVEYMVGTSSLVRLKKSLLFLSKCLYKHYGQPAIMLIDEYDVPLNKAWEKGFYDEMCDFVRSLFSQALKTNRYLEKAVLTGCLRISKESIFTGLNNLVVRSISDYRTASSFGFTQEEVDELYRSYGLADKLPPVKRWYDGYLFGELEIYNPWSVLSYLNDLLDKPNLEPQAYWSNSSGNTIITNYLQQSDFTRREEFSKLINGEILNKMVKEDITYRELEDPNNIYSFLLLTGYLKSTGKTQTGLSKLVIPNEEVRKIYEDHFTKYFSDIKSGMILSLLKGDAIKSENSLNTLLTNSMSYFDSAESFYHGFMVGLFSESDYKVTSNHEAGDGRFDIVLTPKTGNQDLILLELKHSKK